MLLGSVARSVLHASLASLVAHHSGSVTEPAPLRPSGATSPQALSLGRPPPETAPGERPSRRTRWRSCPPHSWGSGRHADSPYWRHRRGTVTAANGERGVAAGERPARSLTRVVACPSDDQTQCQAVRGAVSPGARRPASPASCTSPRHHPQAGGVILTGTPRRVRFANGPPTSLVPSEAVESEVAHLGKPRGGGGRPRP